jgi:hypothetical protein
MVTIGAPHVLLGPNLADYRKFTKTFGATMSVRRFVELFWEKRKSGDWTKLPKRDACNLRPALDPEEHELADLVIEADREQANALDAEMFAQKTRLAAADRALATKPTKKAESDKRIATDKIGRAQRNLADLRRTELLDRDSRIYPGQYTPVMIEKDGQRIVVPMRYQCRLPGWDAVTERRYPGTYNARRDNLEKSWGKLFGYHHGIMVVNAFYENVARHAMEHRELAPGEKEENVVLEFKPEPRQDMYVACLWSFQKGGEVRRTYSRSPPSPTSRPRRSPRRATTDALSPSRPNTLTPGSDRTRPTWRRSTRS